MMLKARWRQLLRLPAFELVDFETADVRHLRRGQSAAISMNGEEVGYLGRLCRRDRRHIQISSAGICRRDQSARRFSNHPRRGTRIGRCQNSLRSPRCFSDRQTRRHLCRRSMTAMIGQGVRICAGALPLSMFTREKAWLRMNGRSRSGLNIAATSGPLMRIGSRGYPSADNCGT